jgi:hypothetical protein
MPKQVHFPDYLMPVWQIASAPTNSTPVNLDLFSRSSFEHMAHDIIKTREPVLSDACDLSYLTEYSVDPLDKEEIARPQSYVLQPVFETFEVTAAIRGFVVAVFRWDTYFSNILGNQVQGVTVVIDDRCGDVFTYEIKGPSSTFMGQDDLHDPNYDGMCYSIEFAEFTRYNGSSHQGNGTRTYDALFQDTSTGHCKVSHALL